jgi:polyisoprenoid-binding protein YceI
MQSLVLALLLAAGQTLDVREGTLTYKVVHRLHEVQGKTKQVEGRALVQEDGSAKVQVRAKVASFDSGNSNRDAHMREATHEAAHPYATLKGTLSGLTLPLAAPLQTTLHAIVELNGEKQSVEVPVKLEPAPGGVHATFSFPISLDALKVERPELLLVQVDDRVMIGGDLKFEAAK